MERVYLGRKLNKRTHRVLAKERHYTHQNWERPDFHHKDPDAMNVDNIQTILENYKSTIQDEDSSSEHKEEDHQHIQNIVQQTLDNILTIFLPKNNVPCSNKRNALLATNLDTSHKTAHLKGSSKLFPITNPTAMKRIALPRKIIKRRK